MSMPRPETSANREPVQVADITALLARARARLCAARVLATMSIAVPVVIIGLGTIGWVRGRVEVATLASGAAALVSAALVSWIRTPNLATVASLLDERLDLSDRAGMALKVGTRDDDIARAIQRDAARHLRPGDIARVVPLRAHRFAAVANLAAVLTMGLWWWTGRPPGQRQTTETAVRAVEGAVSGQGRRTTATSERQAPPRATSRALAASPEALERAPREDRSGRPQGGPNDVTPPQDRSGNTAQRPAPGETSVGERAAADRSQSAPPPGQAAPSAGVARTETPNAGVGRGRAGAGGTGNAGEAARGGSGQSGGVQFGPLAARPNGQSGERPAATVDPAAVRQGQVLAESAISHDDVSPNRRDYLRQYFNALQSMSRP